MRPFGSPPAPDHLTEDERLEALERKDERTIKIGVGLFAFLLFLAITFSIQLSTLGLSFGSLIYGTPKVWPGHTAIFYVTALNPHTSRLLQDIGVSAELRDNAGPHTSQGARGSPYARLRLRVPKNIVGEPSLRVRLQTEEGEDTIEAPLEIAHQPGPPPLRVASHTDTWIDGAPEPNGPYRIALYPSGGFAVRGLLNHFQGIVTNEQGEPVAIRVRSKKAGLETQSNEAGVFEMSYQPPLRPESLKFLVGSETPASVAVPIDFAPQQLTLSVTPGPWVKPGAELEITVRSLPFRTPIHVDVWAGDVLLFSDAKPPHRGETKLRRQLPQNLRGPVYIEAYRGLWAPESSLSTQTLWVSDKGPTLAADEALDLLQQLPDGDISVELAQRSAPPHRPELVKLALSRARARHPGLPLMRSNIKERQAVVDDQVQRLRRHVHGFFLLTVFIGAGLLGSFIVRRQFRTRARIRRVVEESIAAGEESMDVPGSAQLIRFRHLYDLVLVLGALALTAYGLWLLLTRITWF